MQRREQDNIKPNKRNEHPKAYRKPRKYSLQVRGETKAERV